MTVFRKDLCSLPSIAIAFSEKLECEIAEALEDLVAKLLKDNILVIYDGSWSGTVQPFESYNSMVDHLYESFHFKWWKGETNYNYSPFDILLNKKEAMQFFELSKIPTVNQSDFNEAYSIDKKIDKSQNDKQPELYIKEDIRPIDVIVKETHDLFYNLIVNEPIKFTKLLCNYVIDTNDSILRTNYQEYEKLNSQEKERIGQKRFHCYLANLVLQAITVRTDEKIKNLGGYVSLRHYIEASFIENSETFRHFHSKETYPVASLNDAVRTFFNSVKNNNFANACWYVAYMANFGVPFYVKDSTSDEFIVVDKNDEDFIYLKQLGKYEDSISWYELSDWADRFYINMVHEKLHYNFTTDRYSASTEEANVKKEAFLKMIGVQTNNEIAVTNFGENSKLFKVLKAIINRYYSITFDINDRDTWPKQKDVIEWLINEHKLSRREAEAIDIVSRPDLARNKT
ncbi:MAG: hypothetical protein V4629_00295 [Pseudomonadota bacterium]